MRNKRFIVLICANLIALAILGFVLWQRGNEPKVAVQRETDRIAGELEKNHIMASGDYQRVSALSQAAADGRFSPEDMAWVQQRIDESLASDTANDHTLREFIAHALIGIQHPTPNQRSAILGIAEKLVNHGKDAHSPPYDALFGIRMMSHFGDRKYLTQVLPFVHDSREPVASEASKAAEHLAQAS